MTTSRRRPPENPGSATRTAPKRTPVFSDLADIMEQSNKTYGTNTFIRGNAIPGYKYIETGIFMLDYALLGGIPEGAVTQIFGWEASGKTTTAMRIAAAAQRKYPDKAVVWLDCETTFDPRWAERHGVDTARLFYSRPPSGENAVDMLDAVLHTPETAVVILDSLPALVPQAEKDSSAEDSLVAKRAQLIGRACSKILAAQQDMNSEHDFIPTTILINQWRIAIGVTKGDNRVLPGGMQPKFLASTMIEVKNRIISDNDARGVKIALRNEHAFTIRKSKSGNSLKSGEWEMIADPNHEYGEGFINEGSQLVAFAKKHDLMTGSAGRYGIVGVDGIFRKYEDIAHHLNTTPADRVRVAQILIQDQRRAMGLKPLPRDKWLWGEWHDAPAVE